jgi:hypothetical protein
MWRDFSVVNVNKLFQSPATTKRTIELSGLAHFSAYPAVKD